MNWELIALTGGLIIALLIFTRVLFWFVRSVRGRTPAERAARNFAQAARDRVGASKRETRRKLVRNFFRGTWRGFLQLLGLGKRAGGAATRAWLGPSMRSTHVTHRVRARSVSKVSKRINKPI